MHNLKKFKDNQEYKQYLASTDIWLPRVAYIVNDHVENINAQGKDTNMEANDWSSVADKVNGLPLGGDGKRWVDYTDIGKHFVEFANGGELNFTDIQDTDLYQSYIDNGSTAEDASAATWYRASIDNNGVLNINTPEGQATFDDETGVLNIMNFPNDYTVPGGPIEQERYTAYYGFANPATQSGITGLKTRVVMSYVTEQFTVTNPTTGFQWYLALPEDVSITKLTTGEFYFPIKQDSTLSVKGVTYKLYVTDGDDAGYLAGDYPFTIETVKN